MNTTQAYGGWSGAAASGASTSASDTATPLPLFHPPLPLTCPLSAIVLVAVISTMLPNGDSAAYSAFFSGAFFTFSLRLLMYSCVAAARVAGQGSGGGLA